MRDSSLSHRLSQARYKNSLKPLIYVQNERQIRLSPNFLPPVPPTLTIVATMQLNSAILSQNIIQKYLEHITRTMQQ